MSAEKKAEHTPGPWVQSGSDIYAPGEYGANICSISEPRATTLVGYTPLGYGGPDLDEAWANARLIAAAPELLAALREAVGHLASTTRGFSSPSARTRKLERWHQVMRKAEGK